MCAKYIRVSYMHQVYSIWYAHMYVHCIYYVCDNSANVYMCAKYMSITYMHQDVLAYDTIYMMHICDFFSRIYIFRIYAHLLTIHVVYMWCTPISTHIIEYTIVYCVICENMRVHHIYYTFQNSSHVYMCANYMSITYRHQVYSIMCVYVCASHIYHFVWYGMGICNALTCALHISVCVCVCVCHRIWTYVMHSHVRLTIILM